jgi:hypothetical protein
MPSEISGLLQLIEKYSLQTSLSQYPQILDILKEIGGNLQFDNSSLDDHSYDIGETYSISRAYLLRLIILPISYSELSEVFMVPEIALGTLLLLSLRFLSPFRHQKVILKCDETIVRLSDIGPLQYRFINNDLTFGMPTFNYINFKPLSVPFDPLPLPTISKVSESFIHSVCSVVFNDNPLIQFFALSALAELSFQSPIPSSLLNFLSSNLEIPNPQRIPKLQELEKQFWIWSIPVNSICFSIDSNLTFSYRLIDSEIDEFQLIVNAELWTFSLKDGNELPIRNKTLKISIIGREKQIVIQTGSEIYFTRTFVGYGNEFYACFSSINPPLILPENSIIFPAFLLYSISSKICTFSHVYTHSKIYK